jgi:hypothetical protein
VTGSASLGAVGLEWQVAGFNNHGTETDMVLRNTNTGALLVYDIAQNQIAAAVLLGTVGLEWQVAGFGNFSSVPGEGDMMMRNANTGAFMIYDISNNQIVSATPMGAVGLDWQVAGFGPIGGAGRSDMVLRNVNSGAFEVYDIAGNALTGATSLGSVGLDWQVAGIAPDPSGTASGASGAMFPPNNAVSQLVQAMASVSSTNVLAALTANPLDAPAAQQGFLAAHS